MTLKVQTTKDGSSTIYNSKLNENYHSTFGAIQEAMHVYINAGFKELSEDQHSILEIGFGTGLNALLTCEAATETKKKVVYHTLEKYPIGADLVAQLEFGEARKDLLQSLHNAPWNEPIAITPFFTLVKIQTDLLHYDFSQTYDLIYYDAFAPDKQNEMWQEQLLHKVANTLNKNGILTTYSTKGTVKQAFRAAGLFVKRLKGPIGKRDMLRCIKMD